MNQIGLTPEEVISKIMANPEVAMAFQNPRVQAAIMDCSQNPLSTAKYQNDKEDCQSVDAYTDADWAGAVDGRRSTSGYFTFVGRNLVTWRSKKQNVVARSSTEAEFRGMTLGICEALWLKLLLVDLGYSPTQPVQLYCDNKAACDITHNSVQHDRTKHVEVNRFFIKEKLDEKIVELLKIDSKDQLADILTKAVSSQAFSKFFGQVGHV
ncbi:unnamed protein product [Camellia sinensis]